MGEGKQLNIRGEGWDGKKGLVLTGRGGWLVGGGLWRPGQ